jgi:hypothetical protein
MRVRPRQQTHDKKTHVDYVENMSPELITKGRETHIVKIAINRARQPPSPGLGSLPRTVSDRSSMNKHGMDLMLEKPYMHFFIFQNRGQIRPQAD